MDSIIKFNDTHPADLSKTDWIEDFNSLIEMMKECFPYFWVKERMLGYNWLNLRDVYLERLDKAQTPKDFINILWDSVTALQDTHTSVWLPQWMNYHFREDGFFQQHEPYRTIFSDQVKKANEYWKPILDNFYSSRFDVNYEVQILYLKGHYVIVDGQESWSNKFGYNTRVVSVNGSQIDDAVKNAYEKELLKWDYKRGKPYVLSISPRLFGESAVYTLEFSNGVTKDVVFAASCEFKYGSMYSSEWVSTRIWPNRKTAYIRFRDFELDNVNAEMHQYLLAFYNSIKDYDNLIIDVRGNNGGWKQIWIDNVIAPLTNKTLTARMYLGFRKGAYVNLFRKEEKIANIVPKENFDYLPSEVLTDDFTVYDHSFSVKPKDQVDLKARISLLIDNSTWSASAAFALFCKETGFAKLYGMPTKGEAISSGTIFYVLPNSKLVIRFNPCLGLDYTGHSCEEEKVKPDVYYESDTLNQDELIDYILRM